MSAPAVLGAAWLAGTVPVAQVAARAFAGADLRRVGTGTVSGSALYGVAGFTPLAVAGCAELAKGALGPLLAGRERPLLGAFAAAAAVVGHDWSPWLGLHGGRGVSLVLGAGVVLSPLGAGVVLAGMATGRLVRQSGLGTFIGLAALPLATRRPRGPGAIAGAVLLAPVLAKRFLGNDMQLPYSFRVAFGRLVGDRDDWPGRRRAGGAA